ncbi:MAG: ATP-binding protein [Pseudomonadota bacterium]|nr:ATP-binding protein [Pseudomonadota bacterium]
MNVPVVTPNAADRALAVDLLRMEGIAAAPVQALSELTKLPHEELGCVVLVEESLIEGDVEAFQRAIAVQPPWSDLPLILIAGQESLGSLMSRLFPESGNIAVIQRPMHPIGLASAVNVALRARARQLEVRDLLAHRAEALRRRDEFLAMLAHELRNPLAPIRNAVHLLGMLDFEDAVFVKARAAIDKQAKHITRLVDDLLDVSRLELGKIDLRPQDVDLNACATSAVEAALPATIGKGHTVNVETASEMLPVRVDPVRIEQVLDNLILNAGKFTPPGGTITVRTFQDGDTAVAAVEDNGVGIKPENLNSVFDLFVQEETSLARSTGGLGIGLTLVKRLVEIHGGTVSLASPGENKGTRVEVRLPLLQSVPTALRPATARPTAGLSRRVLLVEDSPDISETLGMLLQEWRHEVAFARSGPEGVARAIEWSPDIALIDIGLPGCSGYEVARQIRASGGAWCKRVRLIAMTGYGQASDKERAKSAGFDMHLLKPVDPDHLQRVLSAESATVAGEADPCSSGLRYG